MFRYIPALTNTIGSTVWAVIDFIIRYLFLKQYLLHDESRFEGPVENLPDEVMRDFYAFSAREGRKPGTERPAPHTPRISGR